MPTVYIALGSNLGNRHKNIQQAVLLLQNRGIQILKQSTLIETNPVGGPPQGKFLNAVIQVATTLTPQILLNELQLIEQKLGRVKTGVNGPRPIDLDILLYDDLKMTTALLTIPHPRMWERSFVTLPLNEIAPELVKEYQNEKR